MCSGGGSQKKEARRQREAEEERQRLITESRGTIDQRFNEFDDGYFDNLRTAARSYYQPQFEDQYDEARRRLRFSLARSGNSQSSAGGESLGDLARDRTLGLTRIEDLATNAVERQREFLEGQRQQLYSSAASAVNPSAAASQSIARSDYLSKQPEFNALGSLFEGALNQASIYQEAENRGDRVGFGAVYPHDRQVKDAQGNSHTVRYGG